MRLFRSISYLLIAAACALSWQAVAQPEAADGGPQTADSWRDRMSARGADFSAVYSADLFSNRRGGIARGTVFLNNIDLTLGLDGGRLFGIPGLSIFLYGLHNHGGSLGALTGDLQGADNIEAPGTWKLYEAWIEQAGCNAACSVRFGLYDLNSEFDSIDTAGLFINSSHGIGAEYAQSGDNGPSIFPNTSTALRLYYAPTRESYLQAAILDGVPGDPDDPHGTHIHFDDGDGALLAFEAGLRYPGAADAVPATRYSLGIWHYTARYDDLVDADRRRGHNTGMYFFTETGLYREPGDAAQGLAVFGRYGVANADINPLRDYLGAGLVYTGLLPDRPIDSLGLALAYARTGDAYRDATALAGNRAESGELTVELTYRYEVTDGIAVQPDLQYIFNPGADPALDNALVIGTRIEIGL
jgi:porin